MSANGILAGPAVRYLLVGSAGAALEFVLFVAFVRAGLAVAASNTVAFHAALLLCYTLHYHWTHRRPFEGRARIAQGLLRYAAVVYLQFAAGMLLLWLLTTRAGWRPDVAKLLQMAVVTPAGYLLQKALVFRRGSPP